MDVFYGIMHNSNESDANEKNNYHVLCPYFKSHTMKALCLPLLLRAALEGRYHYLCPEKERSFQGQTSSKRWG